MSCVHCVCRLRPECLACALRALRVLCVPCVRPACALRTFCVHMLCSSYMLCCVMYMLCERDGCRVERRV